MRRAANLAGIALLLLYVVAQPAVGAEQKADRSKKAAGGQDVQKQAAAARQRSTPAGSEVPAATVRWAPQQAADVPEFTRHVIPLLGKAGCNNRACHGSFQGQNGFRLSLFGHDAKMDFDELVKDEGDGPRVNVKNPDQSLALSKPSGEEYHEGGVRFEKDSWQYRLFRSWIAGGAKHDPAKESRLLALEVLPREFAMVAGDKKPVVLRTVARYSDGSREDVTALTLFSTNDESVAEVSQSGEVTAVGPGDTAIVATYGGAVVTTQVIIPHSGDPGSFPPYPANNRIDEFVLAKLKKVNIQPSELSTDAEFLRRVYLDTIGTLPTADEARRFLDDNRSDKRARLIDSLLERPEYAMYWATRFSDWTGNDNRFTPQPREKTGWLWHNWLRDKLARNVPYDELVSGFILATSREGRPVNEQVAEYKAVKARIDRGFDEEIYPSRRTNDLYWLKSGNSNPETLGLQAAYAFLGVRLECAQCHKHPFDQWTQDDFRGFTAFFSVVDRGVPKDVPKDVTKSDRNTYRYNEVYLKDDKSMESTFRRQAPKILSGPVVEFRPGHDPRTVLMDWMRSPENPYFAAAIANRFWGHYFGRGIVEPVDDFNAANPPSNPQLLAWLAGDFIEHGFDLKHLHRRILNSRTYQLSWKPNESNQLDERNFSHALLRRMPAEVVMDAINQVTGGQDRYSNNNAPPGTRTINLALSRLRGGGPEYVLGIFGRPLRTQTCDCERSSATGLAQAMYLLNDTDVNSKIADSSGRLARLLETIADDGKLIEELYLSTLSRYPSNDESQKALAYVRQSESRSSGMQDVMWSLLNLREFVFVH